MSFIISRIIFIIVWTLTKTYRVRFYSPLGDEIKDFRRRYIFAIWHQHLFSGIVTQTGSDHVVIVSRSKDADPVSYVCSKLGHTVTRGSSRSKDGRNKGGVEASKQMVEILKSGHPGAVTVDGPKGPAKKSKRGILYMAAGANLPIIPYVTLSDRYWSFNSWDKFRIPKPFSKVLVYYGRPYRTDEIELGCEEELTKHLAEAEADAYHQLDNNWDNSSRENLLK
jgi:lysophospholipid acyltransferase (LPLAT)-like uncharacterized protein